MRFDRLATLYVARPLLGARARRDTIPILMYHSISDTTEADVSAYYRVCTKPSVFAAHVTFLADNAYRTLTLTQAQQELAAGADVSKSVVITFDDGFRDFYTHAFPLLNRHSFTATMFLPTAFIGEERRSFKGRECLTWSEVREMRKAGMEFGSHTVNHPTLVDLEWAEVERELRDSKADIESRMDEEITTFAYPYACPPAHAEFSVGFRQRLLDAGYRCCVTTEIGCVKAGDDPLRWKRLPSNSCDDAALFEAKLQGAYDWLAVPQGGWKALKSALRG